MFKKDVLLQWTTISEENSAYFEVQQLTPTSLNTLGNWERVLTKTAAGQSFSTLSYEGIHAHPFDGVNYYRLLQYDTDGSHKIYGPVAVSIEKSAVFTYIFDNSGKLSLFFDDKKDALVSLFLYDASGKLITFKRDQKIFRGNLSGDFSEVPFNQIFYLNIQSSDGSGFTQQIIRK